MVNNGSTKISPALPQMRKALSLTFCSDGRNQRSRIVRWARLALIVCLAIGVSNGMPIRVVKKRLAPDFPAFAITFLGNANQQHQQDQQQRPTLLGGSNSDPTRQPEEEFDEYYQTGVNKGNNNNAKSLPSSSPSDDSAQSSGDETISAAVSNGSLLHSTSPNHVNNNNNKSIKSIGRKYVQQTPNRLSYQICDPQDPEFRCNDENAICEKTIGTCVCKPDYFLIGKSGLCQSIEELLNDCEEDLQCKAFNVDLVCDTKFYGRPVCDCAEGYYFEEESQRCSPCYRSTIIKSSLFAKVVEKKELPSSEPIVPFTSPTTDTSDSSAISSSNIGSGATLDNHISTNFTTNATSNDATTSQTMTTSSTIPLIQATLRSGRSLRPCRPIDFEHIESRGRHQRRFGSSHAYEQRGGGGTGISDRAASSDGDVREDSASGASGGHPIMRTHPTHSFAAGSSSTASSDPFKIKTPLEVFMGAIMLFTLFTVAWFFLQRMVHDCRAILKSIRNPEYANNNCPDQNFTGPLTTRSGANHHYFDPTGQAVARLLSSDAYNPNYFAGLTSSIYQRDLAGAMVQHLAANLSPSSTNQALTAGRASGGSGASSARTILPILGGAHNEHDVALYPLTGSNQHPARTAAAAAAAQLLLSPTHPAIAILRAAAAASAAHQSGGAGPDYPTANLLSSMFDPPPKYEEAMAQTTTTTTATTTATTQLSGYNNSSHTSNNSNQQQQTRQNTPESGDQTTTNGDRSNQEQLTNANSTIGQQQMISANSIERETRNRSSPWLHSFAFPQSRSDDLLASTENQLQTHLNVAAHQPSQQAAAQQPQLRERSSMDSFHRRPSFPGRRVARRSRRGRGSLSRSQQQLQQQQYHRQQQQPQNLRDSNDTQTNES